MYMYMYMYMYRYMCKLTHTVTVDHSRTHHATHSNKPHQRGKVGGRERGGGSERE